MRVDKLPCQDVFPAVFLPFPPQLGLSILNEEHSLMSSTLGDCVMGYEDPLKAEVQDIQTNVFFITLRASVFREE